MLADAATATDSRLASTARRLAARVFVAAARNGVPRPGGVGKLVSAPAESQGDLDLERTLDRTQGLAPLAPEDWVTRTWGRPRQALCLLVDRSGSMKGLPLALAALAGAAVTLARTRETEVSVLAFSDRVLTLIGPGTPSSPEDVVTALLLLRGQGRTDIGLALESAARLLARSHAARRTTVLISDCLATTGADPTSAFPELDRLEVLGTSRDPESVDAGRRLARGRGRHRVVDSVPDLWAVLPRVLS